MTNPSSRSQQTQNESIFFHFYMSSLPTDPPLMTESIQPLYGDTRREGEWLDLDIPQSQEVSTYGPATQVRWLHGQEPVSTHLPALTLAATARYPMGYCS
ncbi:hypothetical protein KIN20_022964 [Parelaphostrongylus tenuis]|uniref:Uncharacterized protein n=1 Tax=Parelaphostrongylus tenuis TaxID=148309 RepID=A0AAD5MW66_PARTN|nr:hypothetical protein KIN20_022964 [Parelaphostrongylus tenuis]